MHLVVYWYDCVGCDLTFAFKKWRVELTIDKWQQEYSNIETYKYSTENWVLLLVTCIDCNTSRVHEYI